MMRKNIFSLSFFSLAPASLLAVFALPSYTQLPNTELPPDISPSMTSFSWKGNSLSAINAIPSSGLPSQSNTGALVLTPATGSLDGVFPVPGDSSNLLYRSIVELPLGFTTSNSWVRVYATPATFSSVTDGGVDTGFIDNDFLLYSKEAIGSGTSSPGWYNGVSYSYPLGLPEEFATTGIGSFVISPSLSMDAETNETVSRETTSGFILIGTERDGSLGSSGISTFFGPWNDAEIQEGAGGTGAFSGLGNNFLIVSQLAQYVDVSNQTPPPTSDTTTEVYTLFTGEGGFFNRDPNAGSFYESYATVPNLIAMSNATLSNNSYYQYINDPSGNTPSQITGSGVVVSLPSSSLLEFHGDLQILEGASLLGGTVLFSGENATLTLDSDSTFNPDLLVLEAELLTLASATGDPVTFNAGGFDLEGFTQIWIDDNVTFSTTPGTYWHATTTPYAIPAMPATVLIQGGGTLSMGTPLSTATPNQWSNFGNISPYHIILTATTADTTFYNLGFFATTDLVIGSSPYTYHINNPRYYAGASEALFEGNFALDSGSFFIGTLTMANSASLTNNGTMNIDTLNLTNPGTYNITPGFMNIDTLNQENGLVILGSNNPLQISLWNISTQTTNTTTFYSGVTASSVFVQGESVQWLSVLGFGSPSLTITNELTLAPDTQVTFDSTLELNLSCIISGDPSSSLQGGTDSTLTVIGNTTFLDPLTFSADNIVFRIAPAVRGPGTLVANKTMSVPSNAILVLDSEATLKSNENFVIGGVVTGPGNIVGAEQGIQLLEDAILQSGSSGTDVFQVTGNLTFSENASLVSYVDSTSNEASLLQITGTVSLAGANLMLLNASGDVHHGQSWAILEADDILGDFAQINLAQPLAPGYQLISQIVGDPTYFVTVQYVDPLNADVHGANPLRTANAYQTILNPNSAKSYVIF